MDTEDGNKLEDVIEMFLVGTWAGGMVLTGFILQTLAPSLSIMTVSSKHCEWTVDPCTVMYIPWINSEDLNFLFRPRAHPSGSLIHEFDMVFSFPDTEYVMEVVFRSFTMALAKIGSFPSLLIKHLMMSKSFEKMFLAVAT